MGLGRFFKKAVRKIVKPRTLAAIASYGLTEVVRKVPKIGKPLATAYERGAEAIVAGYTGGLSTVALGAARQLTAKPLPQQQEGRPMALNIGGLLGTVGSIFGGSQNPYFEGVSNVASLATQFFPQNAAVTSIAVRPPPGIAGPRAMTPMGRMGALVGRSFFNRFPNLATSIQQLRDRGMHVRRAQLWNMMKRFGPDVLITGGLLTAAAVSELMIAGPGHRRMNAANSKALRRAARRIKSFHKLCGTIDLLKTRGRRSKGRCATCRSTPCRC